MIKEQGIIVRVTENNAGNRELLFTLVDPISGNKISKGVQRGSNCLIAAGVVILVMAFVCHGFSCYELMQRWPPLPLQWVPMTP